MLKWSYIFLLLLLVSCGSREEKVIDLSDRIPKSNRDYNTPDTNMVDDNNKEALEKYSELIPELNSLYPLEKRSFVERFNPVTTEKWNLFLNDADSISYMRWGFGDSTLCKSAFYNWVDHKDISFFGAQENVQRDAFTMIYTDTVLLMVSGDVDLKYWRKWTEEQDWLQNGDYLIEQRKYGKANWFRRLEDEFIELTEE